MSGQNQRRSWWGRRSQEPPVPPRASTDDVDFLRRQIRSLERALRETTIRNEARNPELFTARQIIAVAGERANNNVRTRPYDGDNRERYEEREQLIRELEREREAHANTKRDHPSAEKAIFLEETKKLLQQQLEAANERMLREKHLSDSLTAQMNFLKEGHARELDQLKAEIVEWENYEYTDDDYRNILLQTVFKQTSVVKGGQEYQVDMIELWNIVINNHDQFKAWSRKGRQLEEAWEDLNNEEGRRIYSEATREDRNQRWLMQMNAIETKRHKLYEKTRLDVDRLYAHMKRTLNDYDWWQEADLAWTEEVARYGCEDEHIIEYWERQRKIEEENAKAEEEELQRRKEEEELERQRKEERRKRKMYEKHVDGETSSEDLE